MASDIVQKHISAIRRGRLLEAIFNSPGWAEVFIPKLKFAMKQADKECHRFQNGVEKIKYNIGKYQAYNEVFELIDQIIIEKQQGERYCEANKISVP